ncbi:hypothetical protein RHGRI_019360 [Rhododendron griersonianum]|uniref:Uncharacterized protein n=1 Tax=Rhododendron griersonianum TaxID=479676 RepID=A0AAV6JC96_9ERIC|nr:hypothetical protein RHGRI_019360 [Rhododendron griersonianum]
MSFNQSRADRRDSSQYRKSGGRSGTSAQPKNFSGGSGKGGGGPAPSPSSTSTNSSLSSNRSMLILFPYDGLASGEASKSFPLQFGSISPGFVNGMQILAPTNSAPPNLDEQQRDQVRHDSQRTAQPFPIPSVPKKQMPRKDGDAGDQSITGEAHQMAKPKREVRFSSVSPVTQTQKTSVHHGPGVSSPHMPPQLDYTSRYS